MPEAPENVDEPTDVNDPSEVEYEADAESTALKPDPGQDRTAPVTAEEVPDQLPMAGEPTAASVDDETVSLNEAIPEDLSTDRPPRRWLRRATLTGTFLVVVGLLAGGVFIGTLVSHLLTRQPAALQVTVAGAETAIDADPTATTTTIPTNMPDLIGLDELGAREALADAGVDTATLRVESRPYVGEPGRVIEQRPTRGTTAPRDLVLVLSSPATVPDLRGKTDSEARAALDALGMTVSQVARYDATVPEGSVIGTDPVPGSPAPGTVQLLVSSAPAQILIDQLDAVDSGCSTGAHSVNGVTHDHALTCSPGTTTSPRTQAYIVARDINRFRAEVGQDDTADPDTIIHFEVRADGRVVASGDVAYGTTIPVDVDITGALRLELGVTVVSEAGSCCTSARLVFADPTLIGSPDAINALAAANP
jgi:hypothetical protein